MLAVATDGQWATVLASLAGFATAITVIAAAVISWERVVVHARSEGLVEFEVETPLTAVAGRRVGREPLPRPAIVIGCG